MRASSSDVWLERKVQRDLHCQRPSKRSAHMLFADLPDAQPLWSGFRVRGHPAHPLACFDSLAVDVRTS